MEPPTLFNRRGLFFEEFEIGFAITSPARTVTEADVVNFAGITGDWTPIHTDAVYAASHPFGKRAAHGMLGISFASALAIRTGFTEGTILALREISGWKFSLPIYLGDTIRARVVVSEKRAVPRLKAGMVVFDVEVLNQDNQVVQQGKWHLLVMSAEHESAH